MVIPLKDENINTTLRVMYGYVRNIYIYNYIWNSLWKFLTLHNSGKSLAFSTHIIVLHNKNSVLASF